MKHRGAEGRQPVNLAVKWVAHRQPLGFTRHSFASHRTVKVALHVIFSRFCGQDGTMSFTMPILAPGHLWTNFFSHNFWPVKEFAAGRVVKTSFANNLSTYCLQNAIRHVLSYPSKTSIEEHILSHYPSTNHVFISLIPGRTVRADVRLDIRKITDVRIELSVQPRISVIDRAPKSVAPTSAWISVLRISEREVYYGYPWLYG